MCALPLLTPRFTLGLLIGPSLAQVEAALAREREVVARLRVDLEAATQASQLVVGVGACGWHVGRVWGWVWEVRCG